MAADTRPDTSGHVDVGHLSSGSLIPPSLHQVLQRFQNIKALDWPRFMAAALLSIQPPLRSESLDEEGGAFTPQQGKGNQLPQ